MGQKRKAKKRRDEMKSNSEKRVSGDHFCVVHTVVDHEFVRKFDQEIRKKGEDAYLGKAS